MKQPLRQDPLDPPGFLRRYSVVAGRLEPVLALAAATARDLLRRPGALLAHLAAATLIVLLPRVAARALDDGGSLALELTISTLALYLSVVAGVAGALAARDGHSLGPAAELLATPLGWRAYAAGRVLGIAAAVTVLLTAFTAVAAIAQFGIAMSHPAPVATLLQAALGILVQAWMFAALGLALGSALSAHLTLVVLLAALVLTRAAGPALAADGPRVLALLVPDPLRVDLSRDAGFGRPVAAPATWAACAALLLQTAGLSLFATWSLRRRYEA